MGGICGYLGDLTEDTLKAMQHTLSADFTDSRLYSDAGVAVCALDSRTGGVASMNGLALAYEGQIWNIKELSRGIEVAAETDQAELLLQVIATNDVRLLSRIQGNFVLAFCNPQQNELILVRDKVGHVPLYYSAYGNIVLFASKISGLLSTGLAPKSLNLTGLDYYLSFGHIPSNETLFKNVLRLPAATVVRLKNGNWSSVRYWQVTPRPDPNVTQNEWADYLNDKLNAILIDYLSKSQSPFGILLSGVDSSILSALIQKRVQDGCRLSAFTVTFEDKRYNEPLAKETAEFLGVDYHEVPMTDNEVPKILQKLVLAYDDLLSEHLGSLPTFMLVSDAAREVKTIFTGDGAGLIFSESEPEQCIHGFSRTIPTMVRERLVEYPFTSVRSAMFREPFRTLDRLIIELGLRCSTAARVYYGQLIYQPHERAKLYSHGLGTRAVTNTFLPLMDLVQMAKGEASRPSEYLSNVFRFKTRMADTWGFYIPRIQRICAHFSLMSWLPYLDERILELAAMIPQRTSPHEETKTVLRSLATKFKLLPPHIIHQHKMGLRFPLMAWMKFQLKDYFEKVLDDGTKRTHHLFRQSTVRKILRKGDPRKVFALVMLFLWLEQYFPSELDP
jgi:asparagine synthase (glutamine-hydrolysing)